MPELSVVFVATTLLSDGFRTVTLRPVSPASGSASFFTSFQDTACTSSLPFCGVGCRELHADAASSKLIVSSRKKRPNGSFQLLAGRELCGDISETPDRTILACNDEGISLMVQLESCRGQYARLHANQNRVRGLPDLRRDLGPMAGMRAAAVRESSRAHGVDEAAGAGYSVIRAENSERRELAGGTREIINRGVARNSFRRKPREYWRNFASKSARNPAENEFAFSSVRCRWLILNSGVARMRLG